MTERYAGVGLEAKAAALKKANWFPKLVPEPNDAQASESEDSETKANVGG